MNVFSNDPSGPCPCDCDEIIKQDNPSSSGNISVNWISEDCFSFKVNISGCGGRTVKGFTLDIQQDAWINQCLLETWTITDVNTGLFVGNFVPAIEQPTFGLFIPPVLPCEEKSFEYSICMENAEKCKHQDFHCIVNFIFDDGDLPCPTITSRITFNSPMGVSNSKPLLPFTITNDMIIIECSDDMNGSTIRVIDQMGSNLITREVLNAKEVLNISSLTTGNYFITISNYEIVNYFYKFNIIR